MVSGLHLRHIRLVGSYWMRFSLRTGGGLMAIFLVLFSGLMVAHLFITPVEGLIDRASMDGHTQGEAADDIARVAESEAIVNAVKWITGQDQAEVEYLLREQPALLSVIWLMLLLLFPFVTSIGSFNQTAGDIGNRGLRYLLLRTERSNIYLGRTLGTLYFSTASLILLMILVLLYVGLKLNLYSFGALMGSGVQGFLALLFLSLPYITLCGWVSSLFDSAFASLAICLGLGGAPIIAISAIDANTHADLEWLERLLPWGWKYELLSGDIGTRLTAYAVMLGFTLLFLLLGMRHFNRRDL
ncbi:MAG: hypothetical protein P1V36_15005 [Planctomycetota bacterium]|nr:hypothetical protein [Planctomycetota bacterium]